MSDDDHPHADIRNGQVFLNLIYSAVTTSPAWHEHAARLHLRRVGRILRSRAAAETAAIPPADQLAGNEDGRRGFRVPCIIVSPFARRGHVSHITFDHTSILQ